MTIMRIHRQTRQIAIGINNRALSSQTWPHSFVPALPPKSFSFSIPLMLDQFSGIVI